MTRATLALALVVSASAALPASRADRTLFYEARAAEQRLHASKRAEASRVQWNRVVLRYRRIVALYPRSPYCDDALMAIGDLSRDMAARFQDPRLKDEAVDAYRMLVSEYPSSSLGDRALFAAFEIAQEGGQRKDVLSAGRRYLGAFPKGSHASAVRAALRESPPERASARSAPASDLAQVINLRFWSGASSTRVVVDLERQVEIHQDRISGPERLWVDLVGTRLQPNLTDRSFPVGDGLLERIRIGQHAPGTVRVVLDFKSVRSHQVFYLTDPARLVIDVRGTPPVTVADSSTTPAEAAASRVPSPANPEPAADSPADAAPSAESPTASGEATGASSPPATLALQVPSPAMSAAEDPPATDDEPATASAESPAEAPSGPRPATPGPPRTNSAGGYSLARQLGLGARRIVIDPGHGGHDPGTIGHGGLREKDLVLDVALRLEKLLRAELGTEVIMTRSTDVFIPLEERTAIANQKDADLFLSIHANSSRNRRARGIETYILNFAVDRHAEEVAARENAISAARLKDLDDLVKAIVVNNKIDESRDFATSIHRELIKRVKAGRADIQDRGVRTAPFYVLIGANMPAVLAEISFVSNPDDERLLRSPEQRDKIARSLFDGVREYLEGLSRVQMRQLTRDLTTPTVKGSGAGRP